MGLAAINPVSASFHFDLSNFFKIRRQSRDAAGEVVVCELLVGCVVDQHGIDREEGAGRVIARSDGHVPCDPTVLENVQVDRSKEILSCIGHYCQPKVFTWWQIPLAAEGSAPGYLTVDLVNRDWDRTYWRRSKRWWGRSKI